MMKQISTRLLTVLGLCMFFLSACNYSSDFTVKGVVAGADGQLMYLENVGISNVVTLDSIKLAPGGKFKFTEKRPEYPDFYRLRLNNQLINFAVDSTETISFVADAGTFATSYSVEGSENSKAIKAITLAQLDANQAISRLRKEYEDKMISDTTYRTKVLAAADAYKEVARRSFAEFPIIGIGFGIVYKIVVVGRQLRSRRRYDNRSRRCRNDGRIFRLYGNGFCFIRRIHISLISSPVLKTRAAGQEKSR